MRPLPSWLYSVPLETGLSCPTSIWHPGPKGAALGAQRADYVRNGHSLDYLEKHADESEDFWSAVEEGGEEAVAGEEAKVSWQEATWRCAALRADNRLKFSRCPEPEMLRVRQ